MSETIKVYGPGAWRVEHSADAIVETPEGRCYRRATFLLSADLLVELFKAGPRSYEITDNAIPRDARVIGACYDAAADMWEVVVESANLEPIPEAVRLPRIEPTIVIRFETPIETPTE